MPGEQATQSTEDAVRDKVHRQAKAYAEARVYSMNNEYLTKAQKFYVEGIYQTPLGVFDFALLAMLAFGKEGNYLEAYLTAAFVNLCFALAIWAETSISMAKLGFIFAGIAHTVACLSLSVYMAIFGNFVGAGIGVACALGLTSFLAPSLWLYNFLGRGMNPKYRIAKKLFGVRFPFEDELA